MLKRISFYILAACMTLVSPGVHAEELRIVNIDLPPYWDVVNGEQTGLCCELGNAIAEEAGLVPRNIHVRLHRGLEEMKLGRADMFILLSSPEAEAVADDIGILFREKTLIIGLAGTTFDSPDGFVGKTIASLRGVQFDSRITKKNGFKTYPSKSYSQSLKLLLGRRVDAMLGTQMGLQYAMHTCGVSPVELGKPWVLSLAPATVYVSRHISKELKASLRHAVERLDESGEIKRIQGKYVL